MTWADQLSAWSDFATAVIAGIATIFAVYQVKAARNISREAEAQESFREYLRLAIDFPEGAYGKWTLIKRQMDAHQGVRSRRTIPLVCSFHAFYI
jgi:hypothetical protein